MASTAMAHVQDEIETQDRDHINDVNGFPRPSLSVETDSLSSQASCGSPNTPSDQLSPRPPSDLVCDDEALEAPSRPESLVTWRPLASPTDAQPEIYGQHWPVPTGDRSVPPLSLPPRIKSQRKPRTAGPPIPEEGSDDLDSIRSPHVIPEPDITFDGTDADKCCDLVGEIWTYAWKMGKNADKKWIAEFAVTRFAKGVIAWYSLLPMDVKYDWDRLQYALVETYGPRSPNSTDRSPVTPDTLGSVTTPSTAVSSQMPMTPESWVLLSPPILSVSPPAENGGRVSPGPHNTPLPPSPMPSLSSLPSGSSFYGPPQCTYGRLRVTNFTDRLHYVGLELNTLGVCQITSKKHEALSVRVGSGNSRILYLDNCPPPYERLGITWEDLSKRNTPSMNRGSTDRANLVFIDDDSTSSAHFFRGRSKDTIWTIGKDNSVRVSWQDENQKEHDLHVVVKAESMWSWPGRISLVADIDAFMTRHHGYIRSTLVFEPLA